jgi:hypothetical protein
VRRASGIVLVLLALAGCGGEESTKPLSKAEFARQADAICAKGKRETNALGTPSNMEDLAGVADRTVGVLDDALSDFRKLQPRPNHQDQVDQWLSATEQLKDDVAEIRDRARDDDNAAVLSISKHAQELNARVNRLGTELGMRVCNTD